MTFALIALAVLAFSGLILGLGLRADVDGEARSLSRRGADRRALHDARSLSGADLLRLAA